MSTVQSSVQLFPAPFSIDPAFKVVVDSKRVGCAAVDHHGAFVKVLVIDVILHAFVDWCANVSSLQCIVMLSAHVAVNTMARTCAILDLVHVLYCPGC